MKNVPVTRLSLYPHTTTKIKLLLYFNAHLLLFFFIFASSFLLVKCVYVTGNDRTLLNVIKLVFFLSCSKCYEMHLISDGKFNRHKTHLTI